MFSNKYSAVSPLICQDQSAVHYYTIADWSERPLLALKVPGSNKACARDFSKKKLFKTGESVPGEEEEWHSSPQLHLCQYKLALYQPLPPHSHSLERLAHDRKITNSISGHAEHPL